MTADQGPEMVPAMEPFKVERPDADELVQMLRDELDNEERLIAEYELLMSKYQEAQIRLEVLSASKGNGFLVDNDHLRKIENLEKQNAKLQKQVSQWQSKYDSMRNTAPGKIALRFWHFYNRRRKTQGSK